MSEFESGLGSISFSDESVLGGSVDPKNLPVFQAGGRIHIDYQVTIDKNTYSPVCSTIPRL